MPAYLIRRLIVMLPMLFGVSALVFLLLSLSPGDYLTPIKSQRDIDPELIEKLRHQFGLDQPWYQQYFLWLNNILQGDFGYSWTYKIPVSELIWQRLPNTLLLNLTSLIFAWSLAIPLGVMTAIHKDGWLDRLSAFLAYLSLSIPEFFLALLAIYFAAQSGWFPVGGLTSIEYDFLSPLAKLGDLVHHLILPTIVLGIGGIAGMMRLMRANFLDTMRAEFVLTARAKGLSEPQIMFRHIFRNAINPFISSLGYTFAGLFGGSLLVENVMNYPGMGQLIYQAFIREDRFVVLGSVLMGSVLLIVGNLLSDLLLAWSDPRIRLSK